MPRALPPLALVLLLALSPSAIAQASGLSVRLTPSALEIEEGGNATTQVEVTNALNRTIVVRLTALDVSAGTNVTFAANDLTVASGQSRTIDARVSSVTVGEQRISIRAAQLNGTANVTAQLVLVVQARQDTTTNATNTTSDSNSTSSTNTSESNSTSSTNTSESNSTSSTNTSESNSTTNDGFGQASFTNETGGGEENVTVLPPPENPPGPQPFRVEPASFSAGIATGAATTVEFRLSNGAATQTFAARVELPEGWEGNVSPASGEVAPDGELALRVVVRPLAAGVSGQGRLVVAGTGGEVVVPLDLTHVRAERGIRVVVLPPTELVGAPGDTVFLFVRATNTDVTTRAASVVVDAAPTVVDLAQRTVTLDAAAERTETFQAVIPADAAIGSTLLGGVIVDGAQHATFTIQVRAPAPVPPPPDAQLGLAPIAMVILGVGAASLAAILYSRRARGIGLFLLYARLAPNRALEHPRRRDMAALVRANPGMTISEAQRALGLSNGTARHHVALLQVAGILRCVPDGKLRRLWPIETGRVEATPELADRIVHALATRGPTRPSELAATLGVTRQAVHYHLPRLEKEGKLVVRRGDGEVLLEARSRAAGLDTASS